MTERARRVAAWPHFTTHSTHNTSHPVGKAESCEFLSGNLAQHLRSPMDPDLSPIERLQRFLGNMHLTVFYTSVQFQLLRTVH